MRAFVFAGLAALVGCSNFLDERLLNGGPAPSRPDAAMPAGKNDDPVAEVPAAPSPSPIPMPSPSPSPIVSSCETFAGLADGAHVPGWIVESGSWRVSVVDGVHALRQTTNPPQYNDDDYFVWRGDSTWSDVVVSARILDVGSGDDCVVARFVSRDDNYTLCVDRESRGDGRRWQLMRRSGGRTMTFAEGMLEKKSEHTLVLRVVGSTLTASIDGAQQISTVDATLARGGVGLSTEYNARFTDVCVLQL